MNYTLDALGPFALVIIAGLFAHACYALSVSMLTLVNSHIIGTSAKHSTVLKLSCGYILGSGFATLGLLALVTTFFTNVVDIDEQSAGWIIVSVLAIVIGWITLLFYYRRGKGTQLWLPRKAIQTVSTRAKKTKTMVQAFGLGVSMVILELPFLIAPLVIAGAVLGTLPNLELSIGLFAYSLAAIMPLIAVTVLIGGGYKISTIQRWRESNKKFLQWTSGCALILLGVYLFAINVWGNMS